jgi:membrane protease YdiL (CAAX protease family)
MRVIVFYVLTFAFTIFLGGAQEAAAVSANVVILPQLAPGIAAVLMLVIFRRDGHRLSIVDHRVPPSRYLLVAFVPAVGGLLVYLINLAVSDAASFGDVSGVPWALLLWMPLGALGEELGWRGYLHKRIGGGLSALLPCLIVGVLWALWHVGVYTNGAAYMAFFVTLMVSYTVVIYVLIADTGLNVLLAAIFT